MHRTFKTYKEILDVEVTKETKLDVESSIQENLSKFASFDFSETGTKVQEEEQSN